METKTSEQIYDDVRNCKLEGLEKWIKVDDIDKYFDDEIKWYTEEYEKSNEPYKIIQRVTELRILKRLKTELSQSKEVK